ncbi:hypothetical protein BXY85_3563 [Roseivirga pacifica]|uniref:Outer membrane protein beta-barrel domain-containing protein n=2 Tax=Roseivirga pacifica TaxID=1267423 RepID=A0A1I0QG55_9BACT|nr:outer membrane beta-barrel protein [Roseivirga pacifica]MCO6360809.1 PorT family protein [Roseivirga pacifica]MCO6368698.1 PorT family protein [Roseivirga pacifica]MCO6372841.1 PorT family protein [Roseivirga pacifica]MCO6376900.1 PorT family protein [Roseivirga pacifica]MCO6377822.1 PorT family protein [Roseivirga pacifica]
MNRISLTLLLFFALITRSFSQVVFEPGYFITESNERIECLIRNMDWKNNPYEIEYKLSEASSEKIEGIDNILEFGINGESKYIRAKVKIDKSSTSLKNPSYESNPVFEEETVLLKVLVEGEASLYSYKKATLTRYFYKQGDMDIDQLVYKRFMSGNTKVLYNNSFRQQLLKDLTCEDIDYGSVEKLSYNEKDLRNLFVTYNECVKSDFIDFRPKPIENWFSVSLKPGLNYERLSVKRDKSTLLDFDFDNDLNFRFGVEAEIFVIFRKRTLSLLVEPTFHDYRTRMEAEEGHLLLGLEYAKVSHQSIEVPVGVRYHFYFQNGSQLFFNVTSLIFDFNNNSSIDIIRSDGSTHSSVEFTPVSNMAIGVGYKHSDKYSLEVRYQPKQEALLFYENWSSQYRGVSLMFGYTLF